MRKLVAVIDPENRYKNAIYFNEERVLDGNHGLESVGIVTKGKRAVLELEISDFDFVILNGTCPEAFRISKVLGVLGNAEKIKSLDPVCELLQVSSTACIGCPKKPS